MKIKFIITIVILLYAVAVALWSYSIYITWSDLLTIKLIVIRFWVPALAHIVAWLFLQFANIKMDEDMGITIRNIRGHGGAPTRKS
jgi:hypothetical protein